MRTNLQTSRTEETIQPNISRHVPTGTHNHPLLKAFAQTKHGELHLTTPEGNIHRFRGTQIGPNASMILHDWNALDALFARGEMGFAESYMDKEWDSPDLPSLLTFGLRNADALENYFYGRPLYAMVTRIASILRGNSVKGSKRNVMAHYDLGNDFYKLWLDESMTYSCALFGGDIDISLEEAQQAKYARILNKLGAKPGDHILEIGCGWGGFALAAAQRGVQVTGVTISEEQQSLAQKRLHATGLSELVEIRLEDYRKTEGVFDHVVSIGMFEHVGENYWPLYFDTVKARLKAGGKAMIQCITIDADVFERTHGKYGFIETYIFPGGMLPSRPAFQAAAAKAGLQCEDIFTFGQDYALTVDKWLERFDKHKEQIKALGYSESFMRMWRMYLASCIAAFTTGRTDVMQVCLSR